MVPPYRALAAARTSRRDTGGADCCRPELRAAPRRHVRTPLTLLRAPASPRTTKIRGVACFIRPLARILAIVRRLWASLAARSFTAAIIVEGVRAQVPAARAYVATFRFEKAQP